MDSEWSDALISSLSSLRPAGRWDLLRSRSCLHQTRRTHHAASPSGGLQPHRVMRTPNTPDTNREWDVCRCVHAPLNWEWILKSVQFPSSLQRSDQGNREEEAVRRRGSASLLGRAQEGHQEKPCQCCHGDKGDSIRDLCSQSSGCHGVRTTGFPLQAARAEEAENRRWMWKTANVFCYQWSNYFIIKPDRYTAGLSFYHQLAVRIGTQKLSYRDPNLKLKQTVVI